MTNATALSDKTPPLVHVVIERPPILPGGIADLFFWGKINLPLLDTYELKVVRLLVF